MFTISKTFSFCYGHRLLGDPGRCRHLHGHTARATLTLASSSLDEHGMVLHFDRLKETIGRWIEENLDHCMLLCERDPAAACLRDAGERFMEMKENPTAENIARMLFERSKSFNLPVIRVDVWESDTAKASYGK
ncbi:MAG: 6-carboxytetrahydropterin synthase [Proteobacteria bacterium]|nr:6-carboxytetrahydropterin synthase [Pseudomonadota bacterium]